MFLILLGAPYTPAPAVTTTTNTSHVDTNCDIVEDILTDNSTPALISATRPKTVQITVKHWLKEGVI